LGAFSLLSEYIIKLKHFNFTQMLVLISFKTWSLINLVFAEIVETIYQINVLFGGVLLVTRQNVFVAVEVFIS
jgi:hypothetical protein